jgi:hypothetical protein
MPGLAPELGRAARLAFAGRYLIYAGGRECGEERWSIEVTPEHLIASGEQVMVAPHPFPNRSEYRATLTHGWRLSGLEVRWTVGERRLAATHVADAGQWRVQIEYGGEMREQQGDYPAFCEVDFVTHLFSAFILQRRDFQIGGEHEFPALTIGPPWMAVTPGRLLYRCVEEGVVLSRVGPVAAKRYVVSRPPEPESEGFTFWADADGIVLESFEGLDLTRPWMRLVEYRRG